MNWTSGPVLCSAAASLAKTAGRITGTIPEQSWIRNRKRVPCVRHGENQSVEVLADINDDIRFWEASGDLCSRSAILKETEELRQRAPTISEGCCHAALVEETEVFRLALVDLSEVSHEVSVNRPERFTRVYEIERTPPRALQIASHLLLHFDEGRIMESRGESALLGVASRRVSAREPPADSRAFY